MEPSDQDLIKAIGAGDHVAFECLVRRYQGIVMSFVYRHAGGDRLMAEDLAQEVFLRVYRASADFEPRGSVKAWILTIAYNLWVNERKRFARRRQLLHDLAERDIGREVGEKGDPLEASERERELMSALDRLPERQRAALLLKVRDSLSYAEIGRVLSVSVSSVESLLFRARRSLRRTMGKSPKE